MSNFINTEINKGDNERKSNNLSFVILCLTLGVSALNYLETKDIKKEPMTVLTYATTGEEAEVTWSTASDNYLLMSAQWIASNYYAVTPASIDINFSNILRLAHPSQYTVLQERLDKERAEFKNLKTLSFIGGMDTSDKFNVEQGLKNKDYFGVGTLGRMVFTVTRLPVVSGSREEAIQSERKTMNVIFTIDKGRFYVVDFYLEEYKKND